MTAHATSVEPLGRSTKGERPCQSRRSSNNGFATRRDNLEVVATYDDYEGAQAAVDRLSDEGFPVEHVRIVGEGLTFVEDVNGRRSYGRAAGESAAYGAWVASFVGLLFGLLDWYDPVVSALELGFYGLVFGGISGALMGLVVHWSTKGKRDFGSTASMRAERFQVMADGNVAADARTRLATPATTPAAA